MYSIEEIKDIEIKASIEMLKEDRNYSVTGEVLKRHILSQQQKIDQLEREVNYQIETKEQIYNQLEKELQVDLKRFGIYQKEKALHIGDVSDSLIFKDLTTLTITKSTEYLMLDIIDGNVANTKYLNKEQSNKLKDFLNCR